MGEEIDYRIAPFRRLRFAGRDAEASDLTPLVAPPYDVIAPPEHRALLERSPRNVVRLTLGDRPGEKAPYAERAALLAAWRKEGALAEDTRSGLLVYGVDYIIPGSNDAPGGGRRASEM